MESLLSGNDAPHLKDVVSDKEIWERQYHSKGEVWRGRGEIPFYVHGKKVLELGCGNGKTAASLANSGKDIICLDISRNALRECGHALSGKKIGMVEGDVVFLPFKSGSFDSIFCYHVLEHLLRSERTDAAIEMTRVLKDDGHIYLQAFTVRDMRFGKGNEVEERTYVRGDGVRYHYFQDGELESLFPGMRVVNIDERLNEKRYHGQTMVRSVLQLELVGK